MSLDTNTLIWLFPITFMLHDFEEIILGERWLRKNGSDILDRIKPKIPAFLSRQIGAVMDKSTAELAFTVSLIFCLTVISTYLAVVYKLYGLFLLASGSFFVHGFMHIGQAIALRKYVPAVISSALFVIPYGLVLFWRLVEEGIVDRPGLVIYSVLAVALTIPLILVMHIVGKSLYKRMTDFLIQ